MPKATQQPEVPVEETQTTPEVQPEPAPVEEPIPIYPGTPDLCERGKTYRLPSGGLIRHN